MAYMVWHEYVRTKSGRSIQINVKCTTTTVYNSYITRTHKRVTDYCRFYRYYCRFLVNLHFSLANLVFSLLFIFGMVHFDRYTIHKIIPQTVMEMHSVFLRLNPTRGHRIRTRIQIWILMHSLLEIKKHKRRKWEFFTLLDDQIFKIAFD